MLKVVFPTRVVDQNVIEEDKEKLAHDSFKDSVHQALERARRIGKAEWHHQIFVMTRVCLKSRFVDISRGHAKLMEPSAEV